MKLLFKVYIIIQEFNFKRSHTTVLLCPPTFPVSVSTKKKMLRNPLK